MNKREILIAVLVAGLVCARLYAGAPTTLAAALYWLAGAMLLCLIALIASCGRTTATVLQRKTKTLSRKWDK